MLFSWQVSTKKAKKLFEEFVLLTHLSFTAAVAVMGRERGLDHIGSRRKELTKKPRGLQNPARNGCTEKELHVQYRKIAFRSLLCRTALCCNSSFSNTVQVNA